MAYQHRRRLHSASTNTQHQSTEDQHCSKNTGRCAVRNWRRKVYLLFFLRCHRDRFRRHHGSRRCAKPHSSDRRDHACFPIDPAHDVILRVRNIDISFTVDTEPFRLIQRGSSRRSPVAGISRLAGPRKRGDDSVLCGADRHGSGGKILHNRIAHLGGPDQPHAFGMNVFGTESQFQSLHNRLLNSRGLLVQLKRVG